MRRAGLSEPVAKAPGFFSLPTHVASSRALPSNVLIFTQVLIFENRAIFYNPPYSNRVWGIPGPP